MKRLAWAAILFLAISAILTLNGCSSSSRTTMMEPCPGAGCPPPSQSPFWGQWGSDPQHTGMVTVAGQNLNNKAADIVYDPFITQEKNENTLLFGEAVLTVHEQAPITDGNDVYMVMKMGSYTSCPTAGDWTNGAACGPNTWSAMEWCESRFTWFKGQLVQVWSFTSDWKPEPNATDSSYGGLGGWEPVFHPVDTNMFLYVPGAAGSVWKVDKAKGTSVSQITPFAAVNGADATNTFVSSPLTADSSGNIYFNVIELNVAANPWGQNDVTNAWLVKIAPDDTFTTVTYSTLVPTAPAGTSTNCPGTFFGAGSAPLPWPPTPTSVPPTQLCGSQRPGVNIAPAIAPDGKTIYTASVAHFDTMVSYLIAVNPDLTPKWAASLQNVLNDGCGVLLPISTPVANSCAAGTTMGVDPTTNAPGSGQIVDQASSSPTVLPDGSIVFGVVDNYNFSRGHLLHFDAAGNYVNAFDFGWDSTPAVYSHNGTFSLVIKDNHYPSAAYCNFKSHPDICSKTAPGPYYISQLDANLNIEWSFQSTTIDTGHPNGYEWCINMPAIDMNGNVYVNSEDGNIYELSQGQSGVFTKPTGKLFLNLALGAAYTPLSVGADGRLYTQNNGHLFAVGN